jgi:hypothetical protein
VSQEIEPLLICVGQRTPYIECLTTAKNSDLTPIANPFTRKAQIRTISNTLHIYLELFAVCT